jgi:hypothetical protein
MSSSLLIFTHLILIISEPKLLGGISTAKENDGSLDLGGEQ